MKPQPYQYQPPETIYYPPQPKNGLGTTGMILGIIAVTFSIIPVVGVIAWPVSIVGVSLSGVGYQFVRTNKADNKGMAITGIATNVTALVICILWVIGIAANSTSATISGV